MWPERVNPETEGAIAAASEGAVVARGPSSDDALPFRLDRTAAPAGGPAVIRVAGEIDFDCATDFHQSVLTVLPAAASGLDLDVSGVSFCDCAFLNALLSVRGRVMATGRTFTLGSRSPTVARLLDLTGVRDVFAPGPAGMQPSLPAGDRLNRAVAEVAGCLVTGADAVEVLDAVIRGCATAFAVDGSDITVVDEQGTLRDLACSNELARRVMALEACSEEGPTAECARTGEPVNVADLRAQLHRWPRFAPLAVQEGLRSVQALPLRDGRTTLGALTLFERAAGSLSDQDLHAAQVFADLAVVALRRTARSPRPLADSVQGILSARSSIERATWLIAESGALAVADAEELLRSHARRTRRPLTGTARAVLRGELRAADILAVHAVG